MASRVSSLCSDAVGLVTGLGGDITYTLVVLMIAVVEWTKTLFNFFVSVVGSFMTGGERRSSRAARRRSTSSGNGAGPSAAGGPGGGINPPPNVLNKSRGFWVSWLLALYLWAFVHAMRLGVFFLAYPEAGKESHNTCRKHPHNSCSSPKPQEPQEPDFMAVDL